MLCQNIYDLGGRKTAIYTARSSADKPTQHYEYDSAGNIIGITDGEQNYTKFDLDAWGRITGIYKPDGSKESYTYDYAGNTTTTTDGNGGEIQYAFNTFNKLSSITDQAGDSDSFTYDKEGNLATHTNRNGRTIQYTYGIQGMLLKKSGEDGSCHTYKYNENGQLVQSESAGVQYRYDYTPSGRVKTKYINNRSALSYEYTRGGKVSSITDISGKKTTYSYDAAGRMTSIKENDITLATYQYLDNDLLKEVTFANRMSTKYEYDREQNLAHLITTGRNGEILLSYSYQYDNNTNRIQKAVIGTTSMYGLDNKAEPKATHYKYDCLQRISSVSYPEGKTESFVYDFAGNRIQKNSENITETYQYDIRNRLICKHKKEDSRTYQTTYKYDQQGSLLSEVGSYLSGINSNANPLQSTDNQAVIDYTKKYTYNDFHQNVQTEVIKGTEKSIQENIYDGEGLRYAVIENGSHTNFVTNGWSNFTELDESHHVKKRIIRGIGIVASEESASYHYYHGNERGDIEYITDQAGKAVNSYEYDAFGRITKAEELLQNRYTYNGEAYDQVTEQYYLRARYYNPTIARFTQEDVYRGDGLNLYAFCRNNAVMYVDPSGYAANYVTYIDREIKIDGNVVGKANYKTGEYLKIVLV